MRGKGARVWDLDGREFVDWGMGINNVLIGHAEDVDRRCGVRGACAAARISPGRRRAKSRRRRRLAALVDGAEMIKFAKNGSDANTAALRLARAVTGRTLVLFDGAAPFLAIHDWFIGHTPSMPACPRRPSAWRKPFVYNDLG